MGQALAAIFRIACDADPAALDQRLVGFLEAFRRGDAAVLVALAALHVADAIERLDDLLGEFRAFAEHRFDDVERGLGETGRIGVAGVVENVVQQENGVVHRRFVSRHGAPRDILEARGARSPSRARRGTVHI